MEEKKIFIIIGTRPEAIKMASIICQLRSIDSNLKPIVCVTAQHREMMDSVLNHYKIIPDYDLNIMTKGQDLFDLSANLLKKLKPIIENEKPDIILVQGDTTTAFIGGLAASYSHVPVGHIEAGLRTHRKNSPFPEEINRHLLSVLADYHFAPTEMTKNNLLSENISKHRIWVTGNTVIDTLMEETKASCDWQMFFEENWNIRVSPNKRKILLVTGHRRENFGIGFKNICMALRTIAFKYPDVDIVYPVHLNPKVKKTVYDILGKNKAKNVFLISPLEYEPFVYLMKQSYLILTDSGGIQEEAPSLGKPVLVMRDTTERPEGVEAGTCKLIGTQTDIIVNEVEKLFTDHNAYNRMAEKKNPYGDGKAANRIISILAQELA